MFAVFFSGLHTALAVVCMYSRVLVYLYFSDINSETEPLLLHLELINTERSLLLLKCMKPEDFTTKSTHRLLVLY